MLSLYSYYSRQDINTELIYYADRHESRPATYGAPKRKFNIKDYSLENLFQTYHATSVKDFIDSLDTATIDLRIPLRELFSTNNRVSNTGFSNYEYKQVVDFVGNIYGPNCKKIGIYIARELLHTFNAIQWHKKMEKKEEKKNRLSHFNLLNRGNTIDVNIHPKIVLQAMKYIVGVQQYIYTAPNNEEIYRPSGWAENETVFTFLFYCSKELKAWEYARSFMLTMGGKNATTIIYYLTEYMDNKLEKAFYFCEEFVEMVYSMAISAGCKGLDKDVYRFRRDPLKMLEMFSASKIILKDYHEMFSQKYPGMACDCATNKDLSKFIENLNTKTSDMVVYKKEQLIEKFFAEKTPGEGLAEGPAKVYRNDREKAYEQIYKNILGTDVIVGDNPGKVVISPNKYMKYEVGLDILACREPFLVCSTKTILMMFYRMNISSYVADEITRYLFAIDFFNVREFVPECPHLYSKRLSKAWKYWTKHDTEKKKILTREEVKTFGLNKKFWNIIFEKMPNKEGLE